MAFEQVTMRLADGQEFGPVPLATLLDWHREGRVPPDAVIVDAITGEIRPAKEFPAFTVPPPPMPGMPGAPMPVVRGPVTATDHLIPVRNPSSLWAYYLSLGGLAVCCLPIGPVAIVFGAQGLQAAKQAGVGRTHSLVGIILGSFDTLLFLVVLILIIAAFLSQSH